MTTTQNPAIGKDVVAGGMHGREDQVIPLQNSYRLEELIDNADLAMFSHCHWSMIERRDDFNRLVRDFFLGN
jgi:pimeloyl-ACP methyl ester carboxylesterase